MSAVYPVDVAEIDAAITSLASRYPTLCTASPCAATTAEGRTVRYLRIRGGSKPAKDRVPVLLVGGLHAREYAPPALLLRLVTRLCVAYSGGTVSPIVTGAVTFPEEKVKKVMEGLDLYVLPLANPDGRAWNRASDTSGARTGACSPRLGSGLTSTATSPWAVTSAASTRSPTRGCARR